MSHDYEVHIISFERASFTDNEKLLFSCKYFFSNKTAVVINIFIRQ